MMRKLAFLLLLAALFTPAAGHALGLGEIRVESSLNQPLDARIELTDVRPAELDALQVRLAPPESFARVGLDRPFILTQLRFAVERDARGQPIVRVTTREPVREPFLNFLVEAHWARGRLLREYTVLLDPPVLMPVVEAPAVRPAETARPSPAERAERRPAEPRPEPRLPTPMLGRIPDDRMRPGVGEFGPIQRDDTLWSIAERVKPSPDITTSQMMLALFDANPDAFYGNINQMKTGYVLRVPDRDAIERRTPAEAFREAGRHTEAWRTGQPIDFRVTDVGPAARDPQLRLTAPTRVEDPAGVRVPANGVAPGDPELERRLTQAQDELYDEREARRALATRLAELERETQELRRLLEIRDAELEALTGTRPEAPPARPEPVVEPPAEEPVADEAPVTVPPAEERPAQPRPERRTVAPPPEPEAGLLDLLTNPLVIALLLGVPIVVALAIVALRRRRASAEANRALEPETDDAGEVAAEADVEPDHDATVVRGDVSAAAAAVAAAPEPDTATDDESAEEDLTASAVMKLDEGDPASEADFHLAYGLYDQAADLMEGAYKQHPDRVDYLMKLLEIYFAWGKADEFVRHAREGRQKLDAAGEWGNVAILGRQMAADEPLFSDMGSTGTRSGVDLDITGSGEAADVDLDTGQFESEFDLGEPEAEETPAEAPKKDDGGLEFDLGDFEYPTDEAAAPAESADEGTQAIDLDDGTQAIDLDDGTQAIDLDDGTQAIDLDAEPEAQPEPQPEDDGGLEFDLGETEAPAAEADEDKTSFKVEKGADDPGLDIDFDAALAGLDAEADSSDVEAGFSDAQEPAAGEDEPIDFDALLGDDDAGTEGEAPAPTDSRIDLARAYIDMGDADGARTLLNEVIAEGDDAQKREAQELLDLIS